MRTDGQVVQVRMARETCPSVRGFTLTPPRQLTAVYRLHPFFLSIQRLAAAAYLTRYWTNVILHQLNMAALLSRHKFNPDRLQLLHYHYTHTYSQGENH